ncbi:CPBP family intramembrane glutamic endopeptidase [Brevirhabdus sp.]|uniref:CPBP family intramembrane glutamic endopeptidase n=1 Tax=Brevirhabdus sp. TaxID=2004514 RepID=UPI00405818C9
MPNPTSRSALNWLPARFATYVRPAARYPAIWRLVLGLVIVLIVYLGWLAGLLALVWELRGGSSPLNALGRIARADTEIDAFLVLFSFIGMAAGPLLAARLLHGRGWRSLTGPLPQALREGIVAALTVGAVFVAAHYLTGADIELDPNMQPSLWLMLLPLTLLGLIVQTGAEELLFRGYTQQQLAARFASPLVWLVLPAVVFGLLHFDPAGGATSVLVVAAAILFGLIAADLTARTGSLGAAWGFHLANNFFAIAVVSMENSITGLALYTTGFPIDDIAIVQPLLLRELAITAAAWAACRITLWR